MSKRLDWERVVEVVKNEIVPYFVEQGVKPTLRTIFYALVSRNLIPNTKSAYKQLSRKIVEARKKGIFAWDFLEDRTRYVLGSFSDSYKGGSDVRYVIRRCREKLDQLDLDKLLSEMFDYLVCSAYVGKWAKQPIIAEIWIEKDALAKTIEAWVDEVNIRVNRGYSSWTFIYENVKELKSILNREHEKVVILYLGDLDPSGVDIERFLKEALQYFGLSQDEVEFKRFAVTPEQVERFNLPPRPEDAETLAKLQRDTRMKKYSYDYIVELDALIAYAPEEFRKMLLEEIDRYFDKEIYESVKRKAMKIRNATKKIVEVYKEKARRKILEQLK